jgi:hypothetical protein
MIDAELAYFHPKPDDDPQGTRVAEQAIAERLAAREVGSELEWHLQRAEEIRSNALAHDLFDFVVDGERPVRDVSVEVLQRAGWH